MIHDSAKDADATSAADADAVGAILAWNVHDGLHLTNPAVFRSYGTFYTHWATPPEGPEEAEGTWEKRKI